MKTYLEETKDSIVLTELSLYCFDLASSISFKREENKYFLMSKAEFDRNRRMIDLYEDFITSKANQIIEVLSTRQRQEPSQETQNAHFPTIQFSNSSP